MRSIQIECSGCEQKFSVPKIHAGKVAKCPSCTISFKISTKAGDTKLFEYERKNTRSFVIAAFTFLIGFGAGFGLLIYTKSTEIAGLNKEVEALSGSNARLVDRESKLSASEDTYNTMAAKLEEIKKEVDRQKIEYEYLVKQQLESSTEASQHNVTFAGYMFTPDRYQRIGLPAWSYTASDLPDVRLIEYRAMPTDLPEEATLHDYATFRKGELLNRHTEARKSSAGEWRQHGLSITYYDNGSIGIGAVCDNKPLSDIGAMLPMQDYEQQTCDPE